jgi:drug/metabolite transporter (DMT)-like permease
MALDSLPLFACLALKFAIALAVLAAGDFGRVRGFRPGHWLVGVSVGAVLFAAYVFQTAELRMTTASNAGLIADLSVAMVPVISALWLGRVPRTRCEH